MSQPLISIIVPAYNIEEYLSKTLDSILAQTYSNIEIIVVNDGSRDHTADIINRYALMDERVKPIHKENGGVTSARLRGVSEASGEWIGFVDGDDYIEPQMYEFLLNNALKYDADISHCGYRMVFPDGRIDFYHNTGKAFVRNKTESCYDLLSGELIEPGLWNKLYKRHLFSHISSRIDGNIKINEDVLMNYFLFKQSLTSVYEDVCPYHYLVRKGSAANSVLNEHHLYDPLSVTRIIRNDAEPQLQPVLLERFSRQLISGATANVSDQPELIRPFRNDCRKELRDLLGEILNSSCTVKLKIMALWASIWPVSYGFVHNMYLKVTGLDKIYDLD